MNENYVMKMAKFIHSYPELQMLPPRVWRTHYEDECKEEMRISSFSSLKQYPSLVRIHKPYRYNLYGSAKIPAPAKVVTDRSQGNFSGSHETKARHNEPTNGSPRQLKLENLPKTVSAQIEEVMLEAAFKIKQICQREECHRNSNGFFEPVDKN